VNDERTGGGTAFDSVDASYGFGVEGVRSQAVNGFSGEGYQPTGAEELGGVVDFAGIDAWRHGGIVDGGSAIEEISFREA
jgi:hypothetical protein